MVNLAAPDLQFRESAVQLRIVRVALQPPLKDESRQTAVPPFLLDFGSNEPAGSLALVPRESLADEDLRALVIAAANLEAGPRLVEGHVVGALKDAGRKYPSRR